MKAKKKPATRAKVVELWSRETEFKPRKGIYYNGENNMYPQEMERVINNSPTASRAANMLAKYIAGKGVREDKTINTIKGYKTSDVVRMVSTDISRQYGSFVHVGYRFNTKLNRLVPTNPRVLDYKKCRIGKEDDAENDGRIFVKDYTVEESRLIGRAAKKEPDIWYYPFNSRENVVLKQIAADAKADGQESTELADMLPHYRGQVYYLNLTPSYVYAISLFDSVYNDCDTEYRMSVYTNSATRSGFLGKLAVLVQGLDEEEEKKIEKDVQDWLGSEESSNVYFLAVDETSELDKVLLTKQLESQYNEKQFSETRENCRTNILGAANNIPKALVFDSTSLFGNSGELYRQAKEFYTEQTEFERAAVEKMMKRMGFECNIIPLYEEEANEQTKEE